MDRDQIEKELDEILDRTKKLIDDAYVCGYRDGYIDCIAHKYKDINRQESEPSRFQLSLSEI